VRFGILWTHRNRPGSGRSTPELYADTFEELRHAETLGFESAWASEHHFAGDGYLPSVMPMLGAFGARTRRIRIGAYVVVMPFHNPIRLAEDAAVVDQISDGRLELAIGTGYRPDEFAGLGVDIRQRGARSAEGVEILLRAWADEPVDFHGRHYDYSGLDVMPKPVQRPAVPIFLGGMSKPVLRRAARLNVRGLAGRPPVELMDDYTAALAEHGRKPEDLLHMTSRFVWVDRSHKRAWADAKPAAEWVIGNYAAWFKAAGITKWNRSVEEECIIGEPDYVIDRLHTFIDAMPHAPLYRLIIQPPLLGLDHFASMRMLDTFATDVMPHFRNDDSQREAVRLPAALP
jgi:alkanesulfonate monooxygenase SsuD/methylene tetrahydromethanopterin reductase-like flavin-dependent oxidoreductase (luciferase family)